MTAGNLVLEPLEQKARSLVRLMCWGTDKPVGGRKAYSPLSLQVAAKVANIPLETAQKWGAHHAFQDLLKSELRARREAEESSNIQTLIEIRDNKGDKSPAAKKIRLEAVKILRGTKDSIVSLSMTQQTISPAGVGGYVIKTANIEHDFIENSDDDGGAMVPAIPHDELEPEDKPRHR